MLNVGLLGAGRIGNVHAKAPPLSYVKVSGGLFRDMMIKTTTAGVTSAKPEYFFLERYIRAYAAEWSAFVEAVDSGKGMPVTLDDGVGALEVAEAATRSAQTTSTIRLSSNLD